MSRMQETWRVTKPARTGRGGIVASQHALASAAGVEILEAGGNAVDAAIATALALGVVEPWMSGIGGIGYLVYGDAKTGRISAVDYGPRAPLALDPGRYRVRADAPARAGGFGWPPTEGDRHEMGYESAVTPAAVAGFALALESFGRKRFDEVIAPAIRLAERGLPRDWHTALMIGASAADLARDPGAARDFLPGGFPAMPSEDGRATFLDRTALAATYRRLAAAGPADFYEGETARLMLDDLKAGGSAISAADLDCRLAEVTEPLNYEYHGVTLSFPGPLTGAPTVIAALEEIGRHVPAVPSSSPDGHMFAAYAQALRRAFATRLAELGAESPAGNTTFLAVVDRDGNMVALNNTLLSRFGARVVLPKTGILLNNAINWFDPVPGRPNSLAPGKRPLCNMAPLVASRDGKPWFALGACGGRKIISAVTQLTSLLVDFSMSLDGAFATPRLDASTDPIAVDAAMAADDLDLLTRLVAADPVPNTTAPTRFAIPSAVMRDPGSGINSGMTHILSPVAAALAEAD